MLLEQLLPKLEIQSLNPVIGKFYLTSTVLKLHWIDENLKKRPGMAQLKNYLFAMEVMIKSFCKSTAEESINF